MDAEPSTSTKQEITHEALSPPKIKTITVPKDTTSIFKVQKSGPIFRIVNPYEVKNAKIVAKVPKNPETKTVDSDLYADDLGPHFHSIKNSMITPPIITKNLRRMFKDLPIQGAPRAIKQLKEFQRQKLKEFVGSGLDDKEFDALEKLCNPNNLRTGSELRMASKVPTPGLLNHTSFKETSSDEEPRREHGNDGTDLNIVKKFMSRQKRDTSNVYPRTLKYRGVRAMPFEQSSGLTDMDVPIDLEPGKDILLRIRVYRPYIAGGEKNIRTRNSVFDCDIVMCGRQTLAEFKDRISCRNDLDMRVDVSEDPDKEQLATAKSAFPSSFLFINNTFYIDNRRGCHDTSAVIRQWASARGMGQFPVKDMTTHTFDDILVKLAHPDVYVHQGNCEHIFMFSEIRLLNLTDPLHLASYPYHSAVSQNQTIYCTTCAEFGAKWLVTGTNRIPFDPAFFCDICFKQYLYKDGQKIGDFKAFHYKGNEINLLKNNCNIDIVSDKDL